MTLKSTLLALAAVVALGTTALTSTSADAKGFHGGGKGCHGGCYKVGGHGHCASSVIRHHGHWRHRPSSSLAARPVSQRSARHLDQPAALA